MLKKKVFLFTALALLILSSIFLPLQASAAGSYYISAYTINVVVNQDGSADLEERLTYSFSGQFNGALRDVDFSRTGGLVNQKVYVDRAGVLREYKQNATNSLD